MLIFDFLSKKYEIFRHLKLSIRFRIVLGMILGAGAMSISGAVEFHRQSRCSPSMRIIQTLSLCWFQSLTHLNWYFSLVVRRNEFHSGGSLDILSIASIRFNWFFWSFDFGRRFRIFLFSNDALCPFGHHSFSFVCRRSFGVSIFYLHRNFLWRRKEPLFS